MRLSSYPLHKECASIVNGQNCRVDPSATVVGHSITCRSIESDSVFVGFPLGSIIERAATAPAQRSELRRCAAGRARTGNLTGYETNPVGGVWSGRAGSVAVVGWSACGWSDVGSGLVQCRGVGRCPMGRPMILAFVSGIDGPLWSSG